MQNHKDAQKPAQMGAEAKQHSPKEQKLARALKANLARRKASARGSQTGQDSQ